MIKRAVPEYNYDEIKTFLNAHPEYEIKVAAGKLGVPTKVVWRVFQLDMRKIDPEYHPNSKTSQILKYLQAHPHSGNARIAKAVGCSTALMVDARRLWRDLVEDPTTAPHYAPVAPVAPVKRLAPKLVVVPEPVVSEDDTVEQVLAERSRDYGDYASKAQFIQGVKYLMRSSPSWEAMDADMRESMEMIAHKMGRTLYGNPTHKDNFLDIAGYAKLVADRL